MKTIIAFIRPSKEETVREALHVIPGLTGASFSDIRGFGRGRREDANEGQNEIIVGTAPRVRVEIMVPGDLVNTVADAIARAAHTGHRGDGKIYVQALDSARRISTGETAEAAV